MADSLKAEGNKAFAEKDFQSAMLGNPVSLNLYHI